MATPVDPNNRLKDIGPPKEIEVRHRLRALRTYFHTSCRDGQPLTLMGEPRRLVWNKLSRAAKCLICGQYSSFKWTYEHFTGMFVARVDTSNYSNIRRSGLGPSDTYQGHIPDHKRETRGLVQVGRLRKRKL